MFTAYEEALNWIHSRLKLGMKPGLKRMEWMMEKLGHPETKINAVHIGGTNGKGSTVTFLRSILQEQGYSVGTFTSPYIEQFNERISVNGKAITDQEIVELTNVIFPLAAELEETELGGPTEFEVITAMSFYYFSKINRQDIVLYEVGLGGRLDSTNIIKPLASIITNIGLDHTNLLGDTHEQIAFEKAGIIKSGTPVFTAVQHQGALEVIAGKAEELMAPIFSLGRDFYIEEPFSIPKGEVFTLKTNTFSWDKLAIGMIGRHQTENAALAVMAARYLNSQGLYYVSERSIRNGLQHAYWPGRFEVLSENPYIVIDGAHNNEGISTLVHTLSTRYADKAKHIVFAALRDKQYDQMINKLDEVADQISFASFDFPRAADARDLLKVSKSKHKTAVSEWETYLREEMQELPSNGMLVVTGSLYFISEAKPVLCKFLKNMSTSL